MKPDWQEPVRIGFKAAPGAEAIADKMAWAFKAWWAETIGMHGDADLMWRQYATVMLSEVILRLPPDMRGPVVDAIRSEQARMSAFSDRIHGKPYAEGVRRPPGFGKGE